MGLDIRDPHYVWLRGAQCIRLYLHAPIHTFMSPFTGTNSPSAQGRIKGFIGPRYFWRHEKYCWNFSVLSIIQANGGGGDARIIEKHG
jgi:hypothetical protein